MLNLVLLEAACPKSNFREREREGFKVEDNVFQLVSLNMASASFVLSLSNATIAFCVLIAYYRKKSACFVVDFLLMVVVVEGFLHIPYF